MNFRHHSAQATLQPFRSHRRALVCAVLLTLTEVAMANSAATPASSAVASAASSATSSPMLAAVKQSASIAQQRCQEFMHDDANEYASCLNALLKQVKGKDAKAMQQRLGMSYFAWIGANNAARLGLAGAEQASKTYLPQFRQWQKQLAISDEALCTTVAGECAPRLAQMAQLEKELKEQPASHSNKAAKPSKAADKASAK